MNQNDSLVYQLLDIISSESTEDFIKGINNLLIEEEIKDFLIWDVRGNVCEPCSYIPTDLYATFDIYELGYKEQSYVRDINLSISYFDTTYDVHTALFFQHNKRVTHIITFKNEIPKDLENNIIKEAAFQGSGCAISQASTDIMIDLMLDQTVDEAK